MEMKRRRMRRQQIDRQLMPMAEALLVEMPSGGWIRSIREALGMNMDTLARRLGVVSKSTISQLEKSEVEESISIKRLRHAADALGCDLVVAFVPRIGLDAMTEQQARQKAKTITGRVSHTMVMESQAVYGRQSNDILNQTAQEILERGGSSLWD